MQDVIQATTAYAMNSNSKASARLLLAVVELSKVNSIYHTVAKSHLSSDMVSTVKTAAPTTNAEYQPKSETLDKLKHTLIPVYSPKDDVKQPINYSNKVVEPIKNRRFTLPNTTVKVEPKIVNNVQCVGCGSEVSALLVGWAKLVTSFIKREIDRVVTKGSIVINGRPTTGSKIVEEHETVTLPVFSTGYVCKACFEGYSKLTYVKDGEARPYYVSLPWPKDGKAKDHLMIGAAVKDEMVSDSDPIKTVHHITLYKGKEFKLRLAQRSLPELPSDPTGDNEFSPSAYHKFGLR